MGICADALTSIEDILASGYVLSKLDEETLTKLRESVLPELTSQITKFTFEDNYLKTKTIIESTVSPIKVHLYEAENNLAINAEKDQDKVAVFVQSESLLDKNTYMLMENNILSELENLNESSSNLLTNSTFTSKVDDIIAEINELIPLSSFNSKMDEIKTKINDLLTSTTFATKIDEVKSLINNLLTTTNFNSKMNEIKTSIDSLVSSSTFTTKINEIKTSIDSLVSSSTFTTKINEIKTSIDSLVSSSTFTTKINEIKTSIDSLVSSSTFTTKINEIKSEITKSYSISNNIIYSNTFTISSSSNPYDSYVDIDIPTNMKKEYNFEFYSLSPSVPTYYQIYTKRTINTKTYWTLIASDSLFENLSNVYTLNLHQNETIKTIIGDKIRVRIYTEDVPTSDYEVDLIIREL